MSSPKVSPSDEVRAAQAADIIDSVLQDKNPHVRAANVARFAVTDRGVIAFLKDGEAPIGIEF